MFRSTTHLSARRGILNIFGYSKRSPKLSKRWISKWSKLFSNPLPWCHGRFQFSPIRIKNYV